MGHKAEQNRADAYQQQQQQSTNAAIANAAPDPYVEAAKKHAAGDLEAIGKGDFSGIDAVNNINTMSRKLKTMTRQPVGDERLASYQQDPNFVAQLKSQQDRNLNAAIGDATVGAVSDARAYDTGMLLNSAQLGQQARLGQASLYEGTLPVAQQGVQFSRRPGFWSQLGLAGIGAGGQVGAAYAGR